MRAELNGFCPHCVLKRCVLKQKPLYKYLKLFLISFLSMLVVLMPDMVKNHGFFMYAGDYTFQQIPFYYHAADYVKNYGMGWDWYTDLGSDFITSYSYYLTGSIFFWMISWLHGMAVVYAMPVMIAIKTAVGALGAYMYIRRYVRNEIAAFIGAFMYAFSGFQMASLVFNSFHDVTALFPFLLLSFDMLVLENKRIFFAVMVCLISLANYFFFVGIIVFVIMYYAVKCIKREFWFTFRNFLSIFIESVIGIGLASVILIPTFMLLTSADRIGDTLYGVDLVSYSDNTIIPKIFQSFFLIPDPSSGGMLFRSEDNTHNWASISLYLPVFTITGVVAFVRNNQKNWVTVLLKICFVFAIIPGLNSIFTLFNSSYYARWYYMPVLMMCLATSRALDENYDFRFGIKVSAAGIVVLGIIFCLPNMVMKNSERLSAALGKTDNIETELCWFSMSDVPVLFWQCMAFSVVFLLIVFVYNHEKISKSDSIKKISMAVVVLTIITFNIFINSTVAQTGFKSEECYNSFIENPPEIDDNGCFRVTHATTNSSNNYSMLWGYMNAGCFHSTESNENDDFYFGVQGKKRMMFSQYDENDYPVYSLLSIKYIFNASSGDDLNVELKPIKLKGCSLYEKQKCYYIYKNDCFIPFGFMYDYCIDDIALENYIDENITENKYQYKQLAMLRALVLDKADIEKYSDYIKTLPVSMLKDLDEDTYSSDCLDRRTASCSSFEYDSKGYHAEISADKPGLVFFSVPCSNGWTAKINGNDTEIIKAHYGLTAVAVKQGENYIEFSYETPGLKEGKVLSLISLCVLCLYYSFCIVAKKKSEIRN